MRWLGWSLKPPVLLAKTVAKINRQNSCLLARKWHYLDMNNAKQTETTASAKPAPTTKPTCRKYFCTVCGMTHAEDRATKFFQHRNFAQFGRVIVIDVETRKEAA